MSLIYRDKAGNTLKIDRDKRLAVRNRKGKMVTESETRKFIKKPAVKKAIKKELGSPHLRILSYKETRELSKPHRKK